MLSSAHRSVALLLIVVQVQVEIWIGAILYCHPPCVNGSIRTAVEDAARGYSHIGILQQVRGHQYCTVCFCPFSCPTHL